MDELIVAFNMKIGDIFLDINYLYYSGSEKYLNAFMFHTDDRPK